MYRAEQAAGQTKARDVAAEVGQSRKSEHDVEFMAPKAKNRMSLQAERCEELAIARLPEADMDPEEQRCRSSSHQVRWRHAQEGGR